MSLCNKLQRIHLVYGYIRAIEKSLTQKIIPEPVIVLCLLYHKYTKFDMDRVMNTAPRFKIVLIGDHRVGKTSLARYMANVADEGCGGHHSSPSCSLPVEVNTIKLYTTHGPIILECWETKGSLNIRGPRDKDYIGAKGGIILFDVTHRISYKSTPIWYRDVTRICGDIPIVLCGNKVDCVDRKVKPKHITYYRKKKNIGQYCDMSVKARYNVYLPFLWLIQRITGNIDIKLMDIAERPKNMVLTKQEIETTHEQWMKEGMNHAAIPEYDDFVVDDGDKINGNT